MRKLIILFISAALFTTIGCQSGKPTTVLLITVDSLRSEDLNGPNLLKLKQRGLNFTDAFTPSPNTIPATVSIMTGLHPLGHGIVAEDGYELGQEAVTLSEVFQTNKFRTSAVVGSSEFSADTGIGQGFDAYAYNFELIPEGVLPTITIRSAGKVVEDAASWIKAFGDMPFFMWVHFADLQLRGIDSKESLARIDNAVGELLAAFPNQGKRTLVILAAPTAAPNGAHSEDVHGLFLYDATTHVPLIIAGPGVVSGESKISASLQDILPTIASFLGFPVRNGVQGADLATALRGGKPAGVKPEWVMGTREPYDLWGWAPLSALRTDSYKYVRAPKPELYDLKADPNETKNLVAERIEVVKQMEARLLEMEKRLTVEKAPGKKAHPLPAPGQNLPDPKDRINELPIIREAAQAINEKDYAKTLKLLEPLSSADPENRRLPYMLALAYGGAGDNARAIPLLEEAVKKNPGDSIILATLGEFYMQAGNNEKALMNFEAALTIEPKMLPVYLNLGYIYQKNASGLKGEARIEELEKALTYLIAALKLGDESARTYFNIGEISLEVAQTMEASESAAPENDNAKKKEPTSKDFISSAIQAFRIALEKDPNMAEAHFMLAQLLAHNSKTKDEARQHLDKFLELAPNHPKAESAKKLLKEIGK